MKIVVTLNEEDLIGSRNPKSHIRYQFWRALAGMKDGENLKVYTDHMSQTQTCIVDAESAGDVWVKGWIR